MTRLKAVMMHSYLMTRGYDDEFTDEDILRMTNYEVSSNMITLYGKVIRMLSEGKSYDEIIEFVDNYNSEEYDTLNDDEKVYVKTKTKKDVIKRKLSFEKENI